LIQIQLIKKKEEISGAKQRDANRSSTSHKFARRHFGDTTNMSQDFYRIVLCKMFLKKVVRHNTKAFEKIPRTQKKKRREK
jgi:hypothetical protein